MVDNTSKGPPGAELAPKRWNGASAQTRRPHIYVPRVLAPFSLELPSSHVSGSFDIQPCYRPSAESSTLNVGFDPPRIRLIYV